MESKDPHEEEISKMRKAIKEVLASYDIDDEGMKKISQPIVIVGSPGDAKVIAAIAELEKGGFPSNLIIVEENTGMGGDPFSDSSLEHFIEMCSGNLTEEMKTLSAEIHQFVVEEEFKESHVDKKPRKKPKIKHNNPTYGKHNKGFSGGNRSRSANIHLRGRR